MHNIKGYPYGGQYYPHIETRESWIRDLELMRGSGVNLIRTSEIFNSWDSMEPAEGQYKFGELREFLDVAAEYDMKVILGTGTCSPPYWLHKKDPDVNILGLSGRRFPNNLVYGWACYNNPVFRHCAERYIKNLVMSFKDHPAVAGYQINNEIGYPFMPLETGKIDIYCYCDHCKRAFREFLREKYITLERLDRAYRWDSTTQIHESWEDVEPPYGRPTAWGAAARWLDWRLFHMRVMENEVKWENDMIKTADTKNFTMVNTFCMKSQDFMGTITALDQFNIAKHVDFLGYDLYPGSGAKMERKPEFCALFYDHGKSAAKFAGIPFGLAEAEAGPIGGWILGPETNTNETDIVRNQLTALSHDVKFIIYMLYKKVPHTAIHWGGVIDCEGNKTKIYDTVRRIGEFVRGESEFLMTSNQERASVGLLVTKENLIILNSYDQENFFVEELRGTYSYYMDRGYAIEFLTDEQMLNGLCENYAVIHAPLLAYLSDRLSGCIKNYILRGGRFIGSARLGYLGENGWLQPHCPGGGIHALAGFEIPELDSDADPEIICGNEHMTGSWHKEKIDIFGDNVNVLAKYADTLEPAVVESKIGRGSMLYFGTHFGRAYLRGSGLDKAADNYLASYGIKPMVQIECGDVCMRKITQHASLVRDNRILLFVTNYANKAQRARLKGNGYEALVRINRGDVVSVRSLGTERMINPEKHGDHVTFRVNSAVDRFDIYDIRTRRNINS